MVVEFGVFPPAGSGLWGATIRSGAEELGALILGNIWSESLKKGDMYGVTYPPFPIRARSGLSTPPSGKHPAALHYQASDAPG